jgi:hypothetical protein
MTEIVPAATVPVQSSWWSKINWTAAVTGGSMLLVWLSGGQLHFTPDQVSAIVTTIGILGSIFTWLFRTFFTKTVTPASVTPTTALVLTK